MSTAEFSLTFPRDDVRALFRQMDRARAVLGKSIPQAQRMAMKSVLSSLATSTKVSPEHREYRDTGKTSRSGMNRVYSVKTKFASPLRRGKATRASWQNAWREQTIYAPNEAELLKRRALIIQMRGVAAESWRQAGLRGDIRLTAAQKETARGARDARAMKRAARRWVDWQSSSKGDDPYIKITNRLRHINEALEGGPQAVDTAMARGARGLEHSIDKQLDRMARKAGRA